MGRPSDAKQRLIEAARAVIFARSFEGVSVDELCAAAHVHKSSFYHFFSSKQDLVLAAIDTQWQWFEQTALAPVFSDRLPPHERIVHFFDLVFERQLSQKHEDGYMHGCPAGNLTLELSTHDPVICARLDQFFRDWLTYFERALDEAKAQHLVPASLPSAATAEALLAYFEGVMLLAKGRNDPTLIRTLRAGTLALMQYRGADAVST